MALPARHAPEVRTPPARKPRRDPTRQAVVGLLAVIAVILAVAALRAAAAVMMPLAFAFFVAVLVHPVPCAPCFFRACPIEHPCLQGITGAQVADAVAAALAPR